MNNVKNLKRNLQAGFTLVELMIVVAIIGILATIAVPQYSKFQAKARQTEVKIQLGAIYTVETGFAAEKSSFSSCLGNIGYARDGTKFYYTVGFTNSTLTGTGCGPGGGVVCAGYEFDGTTTPVAGCGTGGATINFFPANAKEGATTTALSITDAAGTTPIDNSHFHATGSGDVLKNKTDAWSINETKQLLNTSSGI